MADQLKPKINSILLAEDDEQLRALLIRGLTYRGFKVTAVSNGNDALSQLELQTFDLLLTDLIMEKGEGLETIRISRKAWPAMSIIAMTGGGRTSPIDYLMIAIKLGAHRALAKPFSMSDLDRAIESCHEELPL